MNYQEYLKSDRWKELRKKAWKRAKGKCEYCGKPAMACHHVTYPKRFEEDHIDNLIVTCKKCHELNHGIRDEDRLLEEIEKRITIIPILDNPMKYRGLDMSGERNEDIVGRGYNSALESRMFNFRLIKEKFSEYVSNIDFDDFQLHCWKGSMWWGRRGIGTDYEKWCDQDREEQNFSGWGSSEIIQWIIINKGVDRRGRI